MKSLFVLNAHDMKHFLPSIKKILISGTENVQVSAIEQMLKLLKETEMISERDIIIMQLIRSDIISCICDAMQLSNENYITIVLEFFKFISFYKNFYENYAAVNVTEAMLRLCYCINKSSKSSKLFEKLIQSVCDILIRSVKFANLDKACVPQQIILFIKNLDIRDSQEDKIKFMAVTMLNLILQQRALTDEEVDEEIIIDICRDTLKLMVEMVKYGDDDNKIFAINLLCGICAGGSRFCFESDYGQRNQSKDILNIYKKKVDLSADIYNAMMDVITPFVKDADFVARLCMQSCVDSLEFHGNIVSCLNNLYRLRNCNCDKLSNHLGANGYLKYLLHLTPQSPENLRRNICRLLSQILSILDKTALREDTATLANFLYQGLIDLPKDSKRWSDALTRTGKSGTAYMILLYYHFLGTDEIDMVSLQSLVARVMLLPKDAMPISVPVLKPLWFLFAVSSISQPHLNHVYKYEDAVNLLMYTLQRLDMNNFYTHHIDLLNYTLKCQYITQSVINQILNLWLIGSDGDIKPLLSFNCDKVVRYLLIVIQTGSPKDVISLAGKGLRHLIDISKENKHYAGCIAYVVWKMLPNILSSYHSDSVAHLEVILELSNIVQPHTVPRYIIISSTNSIVSIMKKKNTDTKLMNLIIEQACILLNLSSPHDLLKVLEIYRQPMILKKLYVYGFSEKRSQLSKNSVKLLASIIHNQKKISLKVPRMITQTVHCQQPLIIHIKNLCKLLTYTLELPCAMYEIQFVRELLTENVDGQFCILQEIVTDTDDMYTLLHLYEILHIIHQQKEPIQKDAVHQCLTIVLRFCNAKLIKLLPHLCTSMSNYNLVFDIVKMKYASCDFVEFVTTWLHYRKANCKDALCNPRSLCTKPFDEVLDHLKEYAVILQNKKLDDAYLSLTEAVSQFK